MRIQFLKQHRHFIGNGTHVQYMPGDSDEFDEGLANALVYEGIGVPDFPEETLLEEAIEKSEGDAPANKMKKAAPSNKSKR